MLEREKVKILSQKEDHSPNKSKKFRKSQKNKKDPSNIKCYYYQKFGHYLRDCPLLKGKMDKRNHSHVADEEEPVRKKGVKIDLDDEYVCIATLTGLVNHKDVQNGRMRGIHFQAVIVRQKESWR